jgi:Bacteriocin-protection, YdeI or OmpD-Associated
MEFFFTLNCMYIFFDLGDGSLAIALAQEDLRRLSVKGNKRVLVTWSTFEHHCAILKNGDGAYLRFGKAHHKKWGIHAGMHLELNIEIDSSTYQFEFPATLKEILETDPEAHERWQVLSAGKQRSILYQIAKIKSTDKQIDKGLLLCTRLKQGHQNPMTILKP